MTSDNPLGGGGATTLSFWETFGPQLMSVSQVNERVEQLESEGSYNVDLLLDEDDLIQEYRDTSNAKLRSWLCQEQVLARLVELVTIEPPSDATHNRAHKYPFLTNELLACDADDVVGAIARSEPTLNLFFNFLFESETANPGASPESKELNGEDTLPPEPKSMNPVLAGYFSRIAIRLLMDFPDELIAYLTPRSEELFHICVKRLKSRSLLDLFVRLADKVFPAEGFIMKLLEYFDTPSLALDIAISVDEILQYKTDAFFFPEERKPNDFKVLQQISSEEATTFLCRRLSSEDSTLFTAATRIFNSVVFFCNDAAKGREERQSSAGGASNANAEESNSEEKEESSENIQASADAIGEKCWATFTVAFLKEIDSIGRAFEKHCSRKLEAVPTSNGLFSPVGPGALELVTLFSTIASCSLCELSFLDAFLRSGIVESSMRLFFVHPWNTLLHNAVRDLYFRCLRVGAEDLVLDLLSRCNFEKLCADTISRGAREGNFAHMIAMVKETQDWCLRTGHGLNAGGEEGSITSGWTLGADWTNIVIPKLEWYQDIISGDLGGPPPQGLTPTSQNPLSDGEDYQVGGEIKESMWNSIHKMEDSSDHHNMFDSVDALPKSTAYDSDDGAIPPVPEAPPPPPPTFEAHFEEFAAFDASIDFTDESPCSPKAGRKKSKSSSSSSSGRAFSLNQENSAFKPESKASDDPFGDDDPFGGGPDDDPFDPFSGSGFPTSDPFADFPPFSAGIGIGEDPFAEMAGAGHGIGAGASGAGDGSSSPPPPPVRSTDDPFGAGLDHHDEEPLFSSPDTRGGGSIGDLFSSPDTRGDLFGSPDTRGGENVGDLFDSPDTRGGGNVDDDPFERSPRFGDDPFADEDPFSTSESAAAAAAAAPLVPAAAEKQQPRTTSSSAVPVTNSPGFEALFETAAAADSSLAAHPPAPSDADKDAAGGGMESSPDVAAEERTDAVTTLEVTEGEESREISTQAAGTQVETTAKSVENPPSTMSSAGTTAALIPEGEPTSAAHAAHGHTQSSSSVVVPAPIGSSSSSSPLPVVDDENTSNGVILHASTQAKEEEPQVVESTVVGPNQNTVEPNSI